VFGLWFNDLVFLEPGPDSTQRDQTSERKERSEVAQVAQVPTPHLNWLSSHELKT
jgi:hypothetical protein